MTSPPWGEEDNAGWLDWVPNSGRVVIPKRAKTARLFADIGGAMDDKEKPAIEKAADKVNDVVEEITLEAADAAIEPDPAHVAGAANEQVYLPEVTETVANHSGRITPTYESMLPPFVVIPRRKKSTSKKAPKKTAKESG